jgi:hypothetical protein
MLLHTKLAAATHLAEGKFLCAIENWAKFLILQEGTVRLILSMKQGQDLYSEIIIITIITLYKITQRLPWQSGFHGYGTARSVNTHVGFRGYHQTAAQPLLR